MQPKGSLTVVDWDQESDGTVIVHLRGADSFYTASCLKPTFPAIALEDRIYLRATLPPALEQAVHALALQKVLRLDEEVFLKFVETLKLLMNGGQHYTFNFARELAWVYMTPHFKATSTTPTPYQWEQATHEAWQRLKEFYPQPQ